METTKLIAVVGATGAQGGSVARAFLSDPSWKVRAITRNASSSKAQALKSKGAEIVEADLQDAASLEKAFAGVQAIFSVTDFWAIYGNEDFQKNLKPGQTMMSLATEYEMQQGKNIFDAAAKVPTLERLVYSTLPYVKETSKGKFTKAYHFDSKAMAAEYGRKTYPQLWSKTSQVLLGFYLSNLLDAPWTMPRRDEKTGVLSLSQRNPDMSFPFVATETDTGVVVKALVSGAAEQIVAVYRERLSMTEYAKLWSKILQTELTIVDGSFDGPPDLMEEIEATFAWGEEFGLLGEKADFSLTTPTDLSPPLELGTVEDWIKGQDWSKVLAQ